MTRFRPTGIAALALLGAVGCGDDPEKKGGPPPDPLPAINILVDANRDGVVDDADDAVELPWGIEGGAVFLPNIDDDNLDGILDGDTPFVDIVVGDNEFDRFDLAQIQVRAWDAVPEAGVGTLTIDPMSLPHVRVHRLLPDGNWVPVVDAEALCEGPDPICDNAVLVNAADIAAGVTFGIEGRRPAGVPAALSVDPASGQTVAWSGYVEVAFAVFEKAGDAAPITDEDNPDGWDRAHMRVAPWQMNGNTTTGIDTVFSNTRPLFQGINDFAAGLQAAADATGMNYVQIMDYPYSHWTEDWMVTGFFSVPAPDGQVHGIRAAYPRPFSFEGSEQSLPVHWLASVFRGPDHGYFVQYMTPNTGNSYDSGGNHELIPPYSHNGASFPVGRVLYGSGVLPETRAFYEAQMVQAPALTVPTNWLIVGHVDEFSSFVPAATERGWKLMVGSPNKMVERLEELSAQGHGDVQMFVGLEFWDGSPAATSIDEVLADTQIMAWSQEAQGHIDGILQTFISEFGLTPEEIIEIPFMWEKDQGGLIAWNPGTVNAFVANDLIVFPDPHGPVIGGVDVFAEELRALVGPDSQLGSEGQGLTVHFTDDWYAYHNNLGEVHCGTNMVGPPPADMKWWEAGR